MKLFRKDKNPWQGLLKIQQPPESQHCSYKLNEAISKGNNIFMAQ